MAVLTPYLIVNGPKGDIVGPLGDRLLGISVSDSEGYESDELTIRIAAVPGELPVPAKGSKFEPIYGFREGGEKRPGVFTLEKILFPGAPTDGEEMHLVCRAADFVDKMKQTDLKHFDEESGFGTAGKIFEHFAGKHGISAAVSSGIANVPIPYRLQHNESDIGFITELADDLGAIVKPQNGRLVIRERGKSESASGKTLQTLIIAKADVGEGYEIEIEPRTAYSKVEAPWFDNKAGKPDRDEKDLGRASTRLLLPRPFPSKAEAEKAAGAAAQAQNRAAASGSFEMAGQPGAFAGSAAKCQGFGPVVDAIDWTIQTIVDDVSPDGGWFCSIETEVKETA